MQASHASMKLFTRKAEPPETGTAHWCQARGCVNQTAERCRYVDRRGRRCAAVFCPSHHERVGKDVYCRRHAGTIRALGETGRDRNLLPDLENRGPSLVNWIASDIDERVRSLLEEVARPGERVLAEDEVVLAYDQGRRPRWERSWRLVEATGLVLKVAISVMEDEDPLVMVKVGHEMVAKGVPPWIARRAKDPEITEAADRSQRQLFYRFLQENITVAVHRLRQRADNPTWVA